MFDCFRLRLCWFFKRHNPLDGCSWVPLDFNEGSIENPYGPAQCIFNVHVLFSIHLPRKLSAFALKQECIKLYAKLCMAHCTSHATIKRPIPPISSLPVYFQNLLVTVDPNPTPIGVNKLDLTCFPDETELGTGSVAVLGTLNTSE